MSFLEMAEELEKTLLAEEIEEKPKKEKKEKPKRERKPRQPKIDTNKILSELNEIKQAINTLQTQINANVTLNSEQINVIAEKIAKNVILRVQDALGDMILSVIKDAVQKQLININLDTDKLATTIADVIKKSLARPSVKVVISRRRVRPKERYYIEKVMQAETLEERILLMAWYKPGGLKPTEIYTKLNASLEEVKRTIKRLWKERKLLGKRPAYRFVLNVFHPEVEELLRRFFGDDIEAELEERKLILKELNRKDILAPPLQIQY